MYEFSSNYLHQKLTFLLISVKKNFFSPGNFAIEERMRRTKQIQKKLHGSQVLLAFNQHGLVLSQP